MHRVVCIVFGVSMFAYCTRAGDDDHKEASLLRARHILEVAFPDDDQRAELLKLPFGPDAIKRAMTDFFRCTSDVIDSIFKSDGTIDREKLKSLLFEKRLFVESFVKHFITIMPLIAEDGVCKSFLKNFSKICEFRKFLDDNRNNSNCNLTAPQFIEKFNDALIECFSFMGVTSALQRLKEKTGLDENGNVVKREHLKLEFKNYEDGSIGNVLSKFVVGDFVSLNSFFGQNLATTQGCVEIIVEELIGKIPDGDKEIGGKKYTKGKLRSLLKSRASDISAIQYLSKNKVPEKIQENGDVEPERYMIVSEIMDTLMREKVNLEE